MQMSISDIPQAAALIEQTLLSIWTDCEQLALSLFKKKRFEDALNFLKRFLAYLSEETVANCLEALNLCAIQTFPTENYQEEQKRNSSQITITQSPPKNNYQQIIYIQNEDFVSVFPMKLSEVNPIHNNQIQKITVIKQREEQSDQRIEREWREARSKFFIYQIGNKLNQAQVGEQQQTQIIQIFVEAMQQKNQLQINLDELGELSKHRSLIQFINQSFTQINKSFIAKQRECLVLTQLSSNKFTSLKTIQIQYQHKYDFLWSDFYYSISAFALFKFIGANPQLEQVTIQAVKVEEMNYFLQLLNPNNQNQQKSLQQKGDLNWMKIFCPSKSLKLTTSTEMEFNFSSSQKNKNLSQIKDFIYFIGLFGCLSDITVRFGGFGNNQKIDDWINVLKELLQSLKAIKNIRIGIYTCDDSSLKQLLFALSSFTEITSLGLNWIWLNSQFSVDDFVVLLNNNKLKHLLLHDCRNFPLLPPITTLESIDLNRANFRDEFDLNQFIKANKSLRSIKCYGMYKQKWVIDKQLLNQLQTLQIYDCDASFGVISSKSPFSLKHLYIHNPIISTECLKAVFPKLDKLTHLKLNGISFDYQLLSLIPSPHLEQLAIKGNYNLTDRCLQQINFKWPSLRSIQLQECSGVTNKFLSLCKFKNLIEIKWDQFLIGVNTPSKQTLRNRGIIFSQQ